MTNFAELLSFSLPNKLSFFLKFARNDITLLISDFFAFRTNYNINKRII